MLYEQAALDAAAALIRNWTPAEIETLHAAVPRQGLATPFRGRKLKDWTLDMLGIARDGLKRRAELDTTKDDERIYLEPLFEIAERGRTPAELLVDDFNTRWGGRIEPLYSEHAY